MDRLYNDIKFLNFDITISQELRNDRRDRSRILRKKKFISLIGSFDGMKSYKSNSQQRQGHHRHQGTE